MISDFELMFLKIRLRGTCPRLKIKIELAAAQIYIIIALEQKAQPLPKAAVAVLAVRIARVACAVPVVEPALIALAVEVAEPAGPSQA